MANTLTDLIPDLYTALDVVSRELVGPIPSVRTDTGTERAAVGQKVRSHVAPESVASDIVPAVIPPDDGDQNIGNEFITITRSRRVPIRWNGEEQRGLNNNGAGYTSVLGDQFEQALRTLTNEMETDLASMHTTFSRAFGTAGVTPFASDLQDTAQVRKILSDNGSPLGDLRMALDTTAGAKMRTLTQLTKANEASDTSLLRQGTLLDIHGIRIRESAQIETFTPGTGTSYTTTAAGFPIGTTSIPLITGSGTILAGDVVSIAGDTSLYVVGTGIAAPGTIVLNAPGLRVAIPAAATALTVIAASTRNMAFSRSALVLATRLPARPTEGDMATDITTITDARSGMSFEVALYKQYRQISYEISAAWGFKNFKTAHTALLLG